MRSVSHHMVPSSLQPLFQTTASCPKHAVCCQILAIEASVLKEITVFDALPNNLLLYRITRATLSLACFAQCRNWSQVFTALGPSCCTFYHQPTNLRSCIRDGMIAEASGFRWHHREGGELKEGVLVLHVEASQKRRLCVRVAICSPTPGDYRQNRKCHLFNKRRNACQHHISHQGITVNCACPFPSIIEFFVLRKRTDLLF